MNELRTASRRRARHALAAMSSMIGGLALACAAPPQAPSGYSSAPASEALRAGLDLYAASEYSQSGAQFHSAALSARAVGDRDLAHRATIAECTAWLLARRNPELCSCTERLAASQRRMRSSDPSVNTLIALGAIAGGQPLPELRTPSAVRVVLRGASEGRQ